MDVDVTLCTFDIWSDMFAFREYDEDEDGRHNSGQFPLWAFSLTAFLFFELLLNSNHWNRYAPLFS